MNKYNDKGEKHGLWEDYYYNGNLMYKENYVNGKRHGLCEYYSNGKLSWMVNFVHGKKDGLSEWYTYDGDINLRHLEFFL